jgi:hypothetical protein
MKGFSLGVVRVVTLTLVFVVAPVRADAQQLVVGGEAALASGLAGGGSGATMIERARTRLRIGAEFWVDEFPKDIFNVSLLAELEPHSSFGMDLRYVRRVGEKLTLNVGAVGFIYPESLLGPTCGARYYIPLKKSVVAVVGTEVDVFAIGTDLPPESVVWQVLLEVGVHVDL